MIRGPNKKPARVIKWRGRFTLVYFDYAAGRQRRLSCEALGATTEPARAELVRECRESHPVCVRVPAPSAPKPPKPPPAHCVYFFKNALAGLVKVGVSGRFRARARSLNSACGVELEVLGVIRCKSEFESLRLERRIHHRFRNYRTVGEWFECSPFVLSAIEDYVRAGCQDNSRLALITRVR